LDYASEILILLTFNIYLLCGQIGSLNIRHSLESDEGKYECVAENSVGVVYSYGANLYVRGECLKVIEIIMNALSRHNTVL
jgi:hypothetical protein